MKSNGHMTYFLQLKHIILHDFRNRWLLLLPRSAGPDISLRIMEIPFTNITFDAKCLSIHKTLTVSFKNQWELCI